MSFISVIYRSINIKSAQKASHSSKLNKNINEQVEVSSKPSSHEYITKLKSPKATRRSQLKDYVDMNNKNKVVMVPNESKPKHKQNKTHNGKSAFQLTR